MRGQYQSSTHTLHTYFTSISPVLEKEAELRDGVKVAADKGSGAAVNRGPPVKRITACRFGWSSWYSYTSLLKLKHTYGGHTPDTCDWMVRGWRGCGVWKSKDSLCFRHQFKKKNVILNKLVFELAVKGHHRLHVLS